jgi:hypothetical protein
MREQEGAGIGMGIAQRIVDSFGGTIEHAAGSGDLRFKVTVRLPRLDTPSDAPQAATAATEGAEIRLDGLRVLYIDDEADIAEAVGLTLESLGCDGPHLHHLRRRQHAAELGELDVVVTDLSLGGGFDRLRRHGAAPRPAAAPMCRPWSCRPTTARTILAHPRCWVRRPHRQADRLHGTGREMQSAVRRARAQGTARSVRAARGTARSPFHAHSTEPIGSIPRPLRLIEALRAATAPTRPSNRCTTRPSRTRCAASRRPARNGGQRRRAAQSTTTSGPTASRACQHGRDGFRIPFAAGPHPAHAAAHGGPVSLRRYADEYLESAQRYATVPVKQAVISPRR